MPVANLNETFGEGGDSGSSVINNDEGKFVGLYFDGSTDNAGFFHEREGVDLIKDIKRVTGVVDVSSRHLLYPDTIVFLPDPTSCILFPG